MVFGTENAAWIPFFKEYHLIGSFIKDDIGGQCDLGHIHVFGHFFIQPVRNFHFVFPFMTFRPQARVTRLVVK
jgi:hypothetical protein